ncbi:hypothetical protein Hdeb2414_s0006g00207461 [Helianthus debilis subsp. tardiflorus]
MMMLRKPSQIDVKIQDKEEIEEARNRTTTTSTSAAFNPAGATSLLHHFQSSTHRPPIER